MDNLKILEDKLGVVFKDKNLLRQALIHRSWLNENPDSGFENNERLEFLGDAVLELAVTEYLYKKYPNPEGELTNWRAALVNYVNLSEVAVRLDFNEHLMLSRGEAKDTGRARQVILANAMEAIIGSIYLDQGFEAADGFVKRNILSGLENIIKNKLYKDAKSLFQEESQEKFGLTPGYRVLNESGPDHDKIFEVGVFLGDDLAGSGSGPSKQEAEQKAAEDALNK
ncbi:MAG: ribonuclease III [Candidatus Sungbacteria bacterium]|uniref:Ribonuclease 3 n=1 Tax=Candidatus Sungiibacteriota bacterium TaxID=2750080 RepID=A0A932DSM6_9BACT|nr:ribonuclease III [Candidatus Sungbacteria bacterium]MBI2466185.1 ribonuclease III [Candidatus Sungbacteria bacterium]